MIRDARPGTICISSVPVSPCGVGCEMTKAHVDHFVPAPSVYRETPPSAPVLASRRRDPSQLWAVVALVILGAVLRFYGLDREPLWSDEAATLRYAEMPQAWLWRDSF